MSAGNQAGPLVVLVSVTVGGEAALLNALDIVTALPWVEDETGARTEGCIVRMRGSAWQQSHEVEIDQDAAELYGRVQAATREALRATAITAIELARELNRL